MSKRAKYRVIIPLKVKDHPGPVELECGFEAEANEEVFLKAKAELLTVLGEHRRSGFCDFPAVLFDDRFVDVARQVLESNITTANCYRE